MIQSNFSKSLTDNLKHLAYSPHPGSEVVVTEPAFHLLSWLMEKYIEDFGSSRPNACSHVSTVVNFVENKEIVKTLHSDNGYNVDIVCELPMHWDIAVQELNVTRMDIDAISFHVEHTVDTARIVFNVPFTRLSLAK